MRLFAAILEEVYGDKAENEPTSSSIIANKEKRTTLVGIEIEEKSEQKFIVDEVTFNRSRGVPDRQVDLTKDMNEEELTTYVEREWNRGKYQAGKK